MNLINKKKQYRFKKDKFSLCAEMQEEIIRESKYTQ